MVKWVRANELELIPEMSKQNEYTCCVSACEKKSKGWSTVTHYIANSIQKNLPTKVLLDDRE